MFTSKKRSKSSGSSKSTAESIKEGVAKSSHRRVTKASKIKDSDTVKGNIRDRDYLREARRDIRRKKKEIKRDLKIKEILNQPLEKSFSRKSLARIKKIAKKK